jgi:hypothetical protein
MPDEFMTVALCRYRDYVDIVVLAGLSAPDPLGFSLV